MPPHHHMAGDPDPRDVRHLRLFAAALAFWAADEGGQGEASEASIRALAALIRNRLLWARAYKRAMGRAHPLYGDGSLYAVLASLAVRLPEAGEAGRFLEISRAALSGALPDETGGATQFHRHEETPAWAARALPRALIGRHWFYVRPEEAAALYPFLDPVSGTACEERTCGRTQEKRRRE